MLKRTDGWSEASGKRGRGQRTWGLEENDMTDQELPWIHGWKRRKAHTGPQNGSTKGCETCARHLGSTVLLSRACIQHASNNMGKFSQDEGFHDKSLNAQIECPFLVDLGAKSGAQNNGKTRSDLHHLSG